MLHTLAIITYVLYIVNTAAHHGDVARVELEWIRYDHPAKYALHFDPDKVEIIEDVSLIQRAFAPATLYSAVIFIRIRKVDERMPEITKNEQPGDPQFTIKLSPQYFKACWAKDPEDQESFEKWLPTLAVDGPDWNRTCKEIGENARKGFVMESVFGDIGSLDLVFTLQNQPGKDYGKFPARGQISTNLDDGEVTLSCETDVVVVGNRLDIAPDSFKCDLKKDPLREKKLWKRSMESFRHDSIIKGEMVALKNPGLQKTFFEKREWEDLLGELRVKRGAQVRKGLRADVREKFPAKIKEADNLVPVWRRNFLKEQTDAVKLKFGRLLGELDEAERRLNEQLQNNLREIKAKKERYMGEFREKARQGYDQLLEAKKEEIKRSIRDEIEGLEEEYLPGLEKPGFAEGKDLATDRFYLKHECRELLGNDTKPVSAWVRAYPDYFEALKNKEELEKRLLAKAEEVIQELKDSSEKEIGEKARQKIEREYARVEREKRREFVQEWRGRLAEAEQEAKAEVDQKFDEKALELKEQVDEKRRNLLEEVRREKEGVNGEVDQRLASERERVKVKGMGVEDFFKTLDEMRESAKGTPFDGGEEDRKDEEVFKFDPREFNYAGEKDSVVKEIDLKPEVLNSIARKFEVIDQQLDRLNIDPEEEPEVAFDVREEEVVTPKFQEELRGAETKFEEEIEEMKRARAAEIQRTEEENERKIAEEVKRRVEVKLQEELTKADERRRVELEEEDERRRLKHAEEDERRRLKHAEEDEARRLKHAEEDAKRKSQQEEEDAKRKSEQEKEDAKRRSEQKEKATKHYQQQGKALRERLDLERDRQSKAPESHKQGPREDSVSEASHLGTPELGTTESVSSGEDTSYSGKVHKPVESQTKEEKGTGHPETSASGGSEEPIPQKQPNPKRLSGLGHHSGTSQTSLLRGWKPLNSLESSKKKKEDDE